MSSRNMKSRKYRSSSRKRRSRRFRPNARFWLMIVIVVFLIVLMIGLAIGGASRPQSKNSGLHLAQMEPDDLYKADALQSEYYEAQAGNAAFDEPDSGLNDGIPNDGWLNDEGLNGADQPVTPDENLDADENKNVPDNTETTDPEQSESSDDWNLMLVNRDHPIPQNYQPEFVVLSNGRMVDARIYPDLQAMFDDARALGMALFVREAFRTEEEQREIFNEKIEAYVAEGYSESDAEQMTLDWVAMPGTSEHQTGLAVDINPDMEISTTDEVYTWLEENAWQYGFVKRYPSDKTHITGISNEPWHYRYVGKDAAYEMQRNGLCLEEYLEQLHGRR